MSEQAGLGLAVPKLGSSSLAGTLPISSRKNDGECRTTGVALTQVALLQASGIAGGERQHKDRLASGGWRCV